MKLPTTANLSDLLVERARATPNQPAYRQFNGTTWHDWTWSDFAREVGRWCRAFDQEGLKAGDHVALCAHNSVPWACFDQAALQRGLVTVPLYFDDRPENMAYCLNDAGVRFLFVEDGKLWEQLKGQVKTVERAVCLTNAPADPKAVPLARWLPAQGVPLSRSKAQPGDLATIVYTSGTTGRPKGVMLSHGNIMSNVIAAMTAIPVHDSDRFVSFLPLSHMFERTCGYYSAIWAGAQTVYARGITTLADDIREQQPTCLVAVPRIFERIYARMQEQMPAGSPKQKLFAKAVDIGWKRFNHQASFGENLLWPLLKLLVAKKLHGRLGGRIRLLIVGGAAFSPAHARVFIGLGLPIIQGYGLTETSPIITANREHDNDPQSVGRPFEGVEIRCTENGELLTRGPHVMLGYWNNPEATRATIDADGWLHTGDIVQLRDGRVYITGRVKDIIVLSNGEKVPPADVEAAIMRDIAFEQVMLIGEGRAKLALFTVSKIEDEKELCARANAQLHEFPGYARIHHLKRFADAWTVENGLLTPTLKIKRAELIRRYGAEIEQMYERDLCR